MGLDLDAGDARGFGPAMTGADHVIDLVGRAGEQGFDIAVAPVAHPAVELKRLSLPDDEGAKSYALHPSTYDHLDGPPHQKVAPICQGTNSLSP